MTIDELKTYKKIYILGYGLEGKATERFLKKFHPSAQIGIGDQKDDKKYLEKQNNYDLAIRTPLLRPEKIHIKCTTATNLFFGNIKNKTIGVTGTKGKSTTVSIIHNAFKESGIKSKLYGNIGIPMLDAITDGISEEEIIVIEMSNYQLEDFHYSPDIACFLSIYKEHHNHENFGEYFAAKTNITTNQTEDDILFYNGKFDPIKALSKETKAKTQDFTMIDIDEFKEHFTHRTHDFNIQASWAISSYLGVNKKNYKKALTTFKPIPYRLQNVGIYNGVTYYNDSASLNPECIRFAVEEIEDVGTVIMGGIDRDFELDRVAEILKEKEVDNIILIPGFTEKLKKEISNLSDYSPTIIDVKNVDEAVHQAIQITEEGMVCLFSPGGPSVNMYNNYTERGDDFVKQLKKHATKKSSKKTSKTNSS